MALPNRRSTIENGLETSEETDLEQEDKAPVLPQQRRQILRPLLFALCGLLLNVVLMTVMGSLHLPFYLETTGTILTAFLGGYVPAIAVALLTNLLTAFVDPFSIYYGALHILIALVAGYAFKKEWFGRANVLFWLITVGISGGLGGLLTWYFQGLTTNSFTQDMVMNLRGFGWSPFWSWYLSNLVVSCIDKAVTILIVELVLSLIPKKAWSRFQLVSWRQEPMEESGEEASAWKTLGSWSLNTKLFSMLVAFSITIARAAALWPPSLKSLLIRSVRSEGFFAFAIHSPKVLLPKPSRQEPTRMIVPPSLTACLELSSAFWVW